MSCTCDRKWSGMSSLSSKTLQQHKKDDGWEARTKCYRNNKSGVVEYPALAMV